MSGEESEDRDAALMRQAAAGDAGAFSEIVGRHESAVFRFARALAGNEGAAEDALQETFLAAWRGAGSFRGESSVRSWLLTIARNAVHRQHRRRVDEPQQMESLSALGAAAGWGTDDEDPERIALRQESRELLLRAFARLTAADREILALRDGEQLSGEETAAALGLSVAAMKGRLHRARLRLAAGVREAYANAR